MKTPTTAVDRPGLAILGARTLGNALGSGRNSLNALRLVFAAYESAASGAVVTL